MRTRHWWWSAIGALLLSASSSTAPPLAAQGERFTPGNAVVEGCLVRVAHGFLGLRRNGNDCLISIYNDSLGVLQSFLYRGLVPLDARAFGGAAREVMLLASFNEQCVLYRLRLDSMAPAVVWHGTNARMDRIVGVGDYDRDGRPEIALAGEGGFVLVTPDGHERIHLHEEVAAAVAEISDTVRIIVVTRHGGALRIASLRPIDGTVVAEHDLPNAGSVELALGGARPADVVVILHDGIAPAAYVFEAGLTIAPDRMALEAAPIGLVTLRDETATAFAAILGAYPAPLSRRLTAAGSADRFDYPFSGLPVRAADAGDLVVVAARDSIALYDHSLHLLAVAPSVGADDPQIQAIDSERILIASPMGSRVVAVPTRHITWLQRHWPFVAFGAAALAALVLGAGLIRQYRFVRAVYNNLVRAPGSAGIIILSRSQRVRHINQSARRLLQMDAFLPLGRHVSDYLSADEFRPVIDRMRRLVTEGEEFDERVDVAREGSAHALTFRGRPMTRRSGTTAGYIILAEDVTLTLERERLVNWASVAHHIAHEMKTPLGTVRMTAEMLHDRLGANGADPDALRATHRIVRQTVRLREIVDDLLTVARTEALDRIEADLGSVLTSLLRDYNDNAPAGIEIVLELDGVDFTCMIDVPQLTVALRNLLDNAVQAIGSREGGHVHVHLAAHTNELLIIVADNGIGMSVGTLAKLFQPFYTERQGGSGIGTVIIKRVIEGHGGNVRVHSIRGEGTTFTIRLPRK